MNHSLQRILLSLTTLFAFLVVAFTSSQTLVAQNNRMSKELELLYKQYDQYKKDRRPESASQCAEKIMNYGLQHRNLSHAANAAMMIYSANSDWSTEPIEQLLSNISRIGQSKWLSPTDEAILLFMRIAAISSAYDMSNLEYRSQSPTPTLDSLDCFSNDLGKWTRAQYEQVLATLLPKLFAHREALLKVSALSYKPLFDFNKKGKTDPIDHSETSLYMAMINTLSKDSFFNICPTIADEYRLAATVLDSSTDRMSLEKHFLDFRLNKNEINKKAYFVELKALIEKYQREPSVVELVSKLAENYINQEEYLTALSLLDEYISRYPQYYRINVLHGLRENRLLAPSLEFWASSQLTSTSPLYLTVRSRLVESVTIELYEANHIDPYSASLNSVNEQLKPYREAKRKALLRKEFKLSPSPTMKEVQDSLLLAPNLKKGMYVIRLAATKTSSPKSLASTIRDVQLISVSDFFVLPVCDPKGGHELQVFDANSGKASSSVAVNLYRNDRFHSLFMTDQSGRCYLPEGYFEYSPFQDGDNHHFLVNSYGSGHSKLDLNKLESRLTIISDRAIYRPGQRLLFFGQRYSIGYRIESARVVGEGTETILFLDPSGKEIARIECPVDKYGRFDGSFEIPTGQLNGSYSVVDSNKKHFCHVQVEEYKRPSFEVKLEEPSETYSLGSRLEIKGLAIAYSGLPIKKANVSYRLSLSKYSYWRFSSGDNTILNTGSLETGLDGSFAIPISLDGHNDNERENIPWLFYRFVLEVDVTDPNGETHSSQLLLPVGKEPVNLVLRLPQPYGFDWQKEAMPQLKFEAMNMKGVSMVKDVCYRLLNAQDKSLIHEYNVKSEASIDAPTEWAKLPSGEYLLRYCLAEDKADSSMWKEEKIHLFSLKDTEYKGRRKLWSYLIESQFDEYQSAEVLLALGAPQAKRYLYYDLSDASGYVERKMIPVEDSRFIRLKLEGRKGELPDNMTLTIYFVANNELYQSVQQLTRKQAKRGYSFVWSSFRDKLEPGSKETWSLQILNAEGKPLNRPSILAAWMYDASLDALVAPQSKLPLPSTLSYPASFHRFLKTYGGINLYYNWTDKSYDLPGIRSIIFDPNYLLMGRNFYNEAMLENIVYGVAPKMMSSMEAREKSVQEHIAMDSAEAASEESHPKEQADKEPALRSNFAETAFFYPRLLANSKGEVSWSFTLPESLTRWRLELFALGQDLQSAQRTEWIEAKKDFMIQPNLPRFLRQGDEGVAAISIRNESDSQQQGVLSMQLIDPNTEQVLYEDEVPFDVEAKNTSTVSVPLKSIDGYDAVAIRLLAKSAHFSDGEQHLLPLLPATEFVTESIPLHVKAGEAQTVDLNKLFPHASGKPQHAELRFEAVANPLWVALEAMPALIETSDDDLVSLASALYCNHLAQKLSKTPALSAWIANLEANPTAELKHKNTDPWQRYRQLEQENKLRLRQLIQSDSLPINEAKLIEKIAKLQQSDGSFSWYPRMSGSTYLTQYALRLFARLDKLGHDANISKKLDAIQNNAWRYADVSAAELMKDMQEYEKRSSAKVKTLPSQALNYLYLLQLTGRTPSSSQANQARSYFLGILLNSLSHIALGDMPLAAIVLDAAGHKAHADKFRQSLREHLKPGPDGDLHFNIPNRGYYWCDARYGLQTECIEALAASNEPQDQERIEKMQAWLLNQKRTQQWPALPATTDAIYALLLGKGSSLVSHEASLRLTLPGKSEALKFDGTKGSHIFPVESLPQGDISAQVQRDGEGFAWAAFYAEYIVPSNAVRATSNGISLTKRFYREQIKDGKVYLEPLELGARLELGEVLLSRFEIDLERDMDFVKLSDDRSACLEPMAASSYYDYAAGTLYYCEIKDAATNMYFDMLRSGSYVLELRSRVSHSGVFAPGLARISCSYAPEYNARTGAAGSLKVE